MIVIIDTNIVFGALIKPDGKLARVLTNQRLDISRISSHYLMAELARHQSRIVKFSKRSVDAVVDDLHTYLKFITLYDETFILPEHWREADRLTKDVDGDDIVFVALSLQTGGLLWTGDKKLAQHLKKMGFDRVIDTSNLYDLLNIS